MPLERSGILAAGNFTMDYVKRIDGWPEQDTLASILDESRANGGGPYNLLKDLVALEFQAPLEACGLVGEDANGALIQQDCKSLGIDTTQVNTTPDAPTSYTDAMTVAATGRRTFFHQRGANALLSPENIGLEQSSAKIFYLAYLMLLDTMDIVEGNETGASRVLKKARSLGFITAVDCVSAAHKGFAEIAKAALTHTDLFFANELEAAQLLGYEVKPDAEALSLAAIDIAKLGCPGLVILHCPQGACVANATQVVAGQASVNLPQGYMKGATGAGDAFAAGFLYAFHNEQTLEESLRLAVCCAAASLSDATSSDGVVSAAACLQLGETFGFGVW